MSNLTKEQADELEHLRKEHLEAVEHAGKIAQEKGIDSEEFKGADAESNRLWSRIREIEAKSGQSWMA
jgi:hypothetical protein